ncbi:MAG: sulfur carrier protein ThiS [Phycisphaerae bacterium]
MQVTVNGERREMAEDLTILQLLSQVSLANRRVAVEINRELVTRSLHETRKINPGDVIEIVSLVGGG